ncbi:MAG: peroxiredoxin [Proteobacteria bacterium]|nr:peroxiredoxin [Pseudomonadota bacterium]
MAKELAPKNLGPGDRAPAFKLATDGGGEVSSAMLKGKPYVLYFYPKDDTSGCTKEAIEFSAAKRKFDAAGVAVVGVSKDSVASHDKFKTKHKLKITLASDPEIKAAEAYGVWVQKSLYGRKYMGLDRATYLIDGKGVIRQIWRKVRVPGHVEAVLDAAKTL